MLKGNSKTVDKELKTADSRTMPRRIYERVSGRKFFFWRAMEGWLRNLKQRTTEQRQKNEQAQSGWEFFLMGTLAGGSRNLK